MDTELITVVVPCYNEEEVLPMFYDKIIQISNEMKKEHEGLEFEFLFINDGSKDGTLKLLREYSLKDSRVRYISFSRNFGKEAGIFAGLENSKGDYVVPIDADLQHPPELIKKMYNYVKNEDYDCATTRRISRKGEPKLLSFFSHMFYKIINKISQTEIVDGAQDYRFMSRQMVDAVLDMHEYNRFSKGIFSWVGFNTKYIEVENVERAAGKTTWSFFKLFRYSLEGIMAFSTFPLELPIYLGLLSFLAAVITLVVMIVQGVTAFVSPVATLLMVIFLIAGFQFICMGISAQYLSKTYLEVKARPKYLIRETEESYKNRKK